MAGKKPAFITGANAKIFIDDILIAYATDVSYNIDAVTIPVEVMGRYEVLSNEPIAYGINGTFTVVRYTKAAKARAGADGAAESGNPSEALGVGDNQDPARMLNSTTFDLKIYQKMKEGDVSAEGPTTSICVFRAEDCRIVRRGGVLSKRGILMESYAFVGVLAGDAVEGTGEGTVSKSGDTDLS